MFSCNLKWVFFKNINLHYYCNNFSPPCRIFKFFFFYVLNDDISFLCVQYELCTVHTNVRCYNWKSTVNSKMSINQSILGGKAPKRYPQLKVLSESSVRDLSGKVHWLIWLITIWIVIEICVSNNFFFYYLFLTQG